MDAPVHRSPVIERWGARLPAAFFTRIHLPVSFERDVAGSAGAFRVIGKDRGDTPCYCHYRCDFDCPWCIAAIRGRPGPGLRVVATRELWAWRMHVGKWLVCTLGDPYHAAVRFSTRSAMPASVCPDGDDRE